MARNFIARLRLYVHFWAVLAAKRRADIDLTNTSLLTTTALLVAVLPWCPLGHCTIYHGCMTTLSLLEIASASKTTKHSMALNFTDTTLLCISGAW